MRESPWSISLTLVYFTKADLFSIDDLTVPFVTACVEPYDPFSGHAESGIDM